MTEIPTLAARCESLAAKMEGRDRGKMYPHHLAEEWGLELIEIANALRGAEVAIENAKLGNIGLEHAYSILRGRDQKAGAK